MGMKVVVLLFLISALVTIDAFAPSRAKASARRRGVVTSTKRSKRDLSADECPIYVCSGKGGQCGDVSNNTYACPSSQYCNAGTCTNYVNVGGSCIKLDGGDNCVWNALCVAPPAQKGVCTSITYGQTNGQTCDPNGETSMCTAASYCTSGGVCAILPITGQPCSDIGCAGAAYCPSGASPVCTALFGGAIGSACLALEECAPGLFCNETSETCATAPPSSKDPCGNGQECTSSIEECICVDLPTQEPAACFSPVDPVFVFNATQAAAWTNVFNCYQTNNCAVDTCAACKAEACANYFYNYAWPTGLECEDDPFLYQLCAGGPAPYVTTTSTSNGYCLAASSGLLALSLATAAANL